MSAFSPAKPMGPAPTLLLDEDQRDFSSSVGRFLGDKSREPDVRRLMATERGYDPEVWSQMSSQLALPGLTIPEAFGGSGYGSFEQAIVFEQMGRVLLCAPYLATAALAPAALLACEDEAAQKDLLPGIASGEVIATVAVAEGDGRWHEESVRTTAARDAGAWSLHGEKRFVLDGHTADLLLVAARSERGVSLFGVDAGAEGVRRARIETLDQTRKLATVTLDGATARLIGDEGAAGPAIAAAVERAMIALAAEQAGGAAAMLHLTVAYAKDRIQFGRPIGSFQAIKHRLADMMLAVEQAKSAAYYAGWAADNAPEDRALAARLAKSYCSQAYFDVAAAAIQLHGGIGFTWEHAAHLYFKRATSSRQMFGNERDQLEEIAALAGIAAVA